MTGRSLVSVLRSERQGRVDPGRNRVITGRERQKAVARKDFSPYPQRSLRTRDHLFIVNFRPERWPMGDPQGVTGSESPTTAELTQNTFAAFADMDASPTKAWLVARRDESHWTRYYDYAFGRRPAEELYVLSGDPDQIRNGADEPAYRSVCDRLRGQLLGELRRVGDPRVVSAGQTCERPPFSGPLSR